MTRPRRLLAAAIGAGALLLPVCTLSAGTAVATGGLVTVQTVPAVAGVALRLGGQVQSTDGAGAASFSTSDLDTARDSVVLVSGDVGPTTRVELLHVASDPAHAIGARRLVAELSVSRPVSLQIHDRRGAPVDPGLVTGMTVRDSDGHAMTVRPGSAPVWLPSSTAVRGARPPGEARSETYTVEGVRVSGVPVVVGKAAPLAPGDGTWSIPLAGYPFNVTVHTVPAVASVRLRLDGETVSTDASGTATFYTGSLHRLSKRIGLATRSAAPNVRVTLRHATSTAKHAVGSRTLLLALDVQAAVRFTFVDVAGKRVVGDRITSVQLGAPHGQTIRLGAVTLAEPVWLAASRLVQTTPPKAHPVTYTVDAVTTYGTNAVFSGGQRFDPVVQSNWLVRLHLYRLRVDATDFLFGARSKGSVVLTAPDGSRHTVPLHSGTAVFTQVPRGEYQLVVDSGAKRMTQPLRVARDQIVAMRVISWADILALVTLAGLLAGSVMWFGLRGRRRRMERSRVRAALGSTATKVGVVVAVLAIAAGALVAGTPSPARASTLCQAPTITTSVPRAQQGSDFPVPVWGYYYIWYTPASWHRAKLDEPQLGCYSSDDAAIMRAHIRMAESAGITGFLVSWKHNPILDRRLRELDRIAAEEHFRLGIVYEALDFYRHPLPAATVRGDLAWFARTYGDDPVFVGDGKPTVVWTGTEDYPVPVIQAVGGAVRKQLTLLASAKSTQDYDRVSAYVDGDAYYWSSGDPAQPSYAKRLAQIGADVHASGGLWIAPAAPGFNAVALGGHRHVKRNGGATLRLSLAAALASAPDALGIISWNEWSENTYVEPSFRYGTSELAVLAETLHGRVPAIDPVDSSDDAATTGGWRAWQALVLIIVICTVTVAVVERRRRRALHREVERALRVEYVEIAGGQHRRPDGGEG